MISWQNTEVGDQMSLSTVHSTHSHSIDIVYRAVMAVCLAGLHLQTPCFIYPLNDCSFAFSLSIVDIHRPSLLPAAQYPVTERNVKRQSLSHVHCSEPRTCVLAGLWCCVCVYLLTVNSLANLLFCSDISPGKLSAFFPHLAQPRCSQHNLIRLCQIYFLKPRYL